MDRIQYKIPPQIMNSRDMETLQWSDIYLNGMDSWLMRSRGGNRTPSGHDSVGRVRGKPQAEVQSGASPTERVL